MLPLIGSFSLQEGLGDLNGVVKKNFPWVLVNPLNAKSIGHDRTSSPIQSVRQVSSNGTVGHPQRGPSWRRTESPVDSVSPWSCALNACDSRGRGLPFPSLGTTESTGEERERRGGRGATSKIRAGAEKNAGEKNHSPSARSSVVLMVLHRKPTNLALRPWAHLARKIKYLNQNGFCDG